MKSEDSSKGKPVPDQLSSPLEGIVFIENLGIKFVDANNGHARLSLNLEPRHLNSWGVVHGGVIMSLLDVVMSLAGRTLAPEARAGVTIDMNTSFIQPGGSTGCLMATGTAYHRTRTMVFCTGEVRDEDDKLIAKAMGTFKYLKRLEGAASHLTA